MKSSQSGSAHVIVVSILTVALIAAIGFIFWQNILNKPKAANNAIQTTSSKSTANISKPSVSISPQVSAVAQLKTFNGGFGVNWVSFNYPANWTVAAGDDGSNGVGPGLIIKSPEYKVIFLGQANGPSGDYIETSSMTTWDASISNWQSQQGAADPGGTFGNFTFDGKPAAIFRSESEYNGSKPPTPGLADMYKGEDTWIQGKSVIYTFDGSTGSINHQGSTQELYSAIKTVLDSWKWQ